MQAKWSTYAYATVRFAFSGEMARRAAEDSSNELPPDAGADAAALLDGRDPLAAAVAGIVRDPDRVSRNLLALRQHYADAHLPGVVAILTPGSRTVAMLSELTCSNLAEWLSDNTTV